MVRRYEEEKEERSGNLIYWLGVILIAVAWVFAFKLYFNNYENIHPDIAWASPGMSKNIATVEGVYLWDETPITAPIAGKVYFPHGKGPVRVAFGQVIAKIVGETSTKEIRAFQQGYFIAGSDSKEGNWRYSLIWPELKELPETNPVKMIEEGTAVEAQTVVGKLVPQPQQVRFIGLVGASSKIKPQLEDKRLHYMMDAGDTSSTADVSIFVEENGKIKFLVTLPAFAPELLLNRRGKIIVETGHENGAVVPQSAITTRHDKTGVFLVRGTRVIFKEVKGHKIENKRFLVTEGINIGDAIVEDAENTKEGRIQVW